MRVRRRKLVLAGAAAVALKALDFKWGGVGEGEADDASGEYPTRYVQFSIRGTEFVLDWWRRRP